MFRPVLVNFETPVLKSAPAGASSALAMAVSRKKTSMGLILGIITGASLLASALVAVWMVGGCSVVAAKPSGAAGSRPLGRWRDVMLLIWRPALAADRRQSRRVVFSPGGTG
jgi:hypothetical protein